jgi:hypothetical protein
MGEDCQVSFKRWLGRDDNEVDWANVAEELEDMEKSEKWALRSQLRSANSAPVR